MRGFFQWSVVACLLASFMNSASADDVCNGSKDLCHVRYNEATYPASHNAQSHKTNWALFFLPGSNINNQQMDVYPQLKSGIRAMKLPVHGYENKAYACHGMGRHIKRIIENKVCDQLPLLSTQCTNLVDGLNPCLIDPAASALTLVLDEVGTFLKDNPREVVTLFLEDFTEDLSNLDKSFKNSKAFQYLYYQNPKKLWPTLGKLIRSNQRLVVFINRGKDPFGHSLRHYHSYNLTKDFAQSSAYSFRSVNDLRADRPRVADILWAKLTQKRGEIQNKLWILQHFVTPAIAGNPKDAEQVNEASFLRQRVKRYQTKLGMKPNFIWVDFFDLPNQKPGVLDVVNQLNQKRAEYRVDLDPVHKEFPQS